MSQIWKPQPIAIYMSWCEAIMDEASEELNNWESNFITSIHARLASKTPLTEKQANILERIYTEKTK